MATKNNTRVPICLFHLRTIVNDLNRVISKLKHDLSQMHMLNISEDLRLYGGVYAF